MRLRRAIRSRRGFPYRCRFGMRRKRIGHSRFWRKRARYKCPCRKHFGRCVSECSWINLARRGSSVAENRRDAAEVVESLEIEPELGAGAKKVGETEGGVAGNGAGAVENLRYAIGGHGDFARQFGGAEVERLQFFGQVFAWMDSLNRHAGAPSDNRQFRCPS